MYYLLYYSVLAVTCGMLDVVALVVYHDIFLNVGEIVEVFL